MLFGEGRGVVVSVADSIESSGSIDDPASYWRTGFTLAAVAAGYAYEREEVVETLSRRLCDGEHVAVVGENGVGKSTACKAVACRWEREGIGPAYYCSHPIGDFAGVGDELTDGLDDDERGLLVVENATIDRGAAVRTLLESIGDDDVSVLLECHRSSTAAETAVVDEGTDQRRVQSLVGESTSVYTVPALDEAEFADAVTHFEGISGRRLLGSPAALFDDLRSDGVGGTELLHLAHRLGSGGDGDSSLRRSVDEEFARLEGSDRVTADLALLVNVLSAANLPLQPAFLFAVDAPNDRLDAAIGDLLGGTVRYQRASRTFTTNHRIWASLYLRRVLEDADRPHERFGSIVRAILESMDADRRAETWAWIRDHSRHVATDADDREADDRRLLRSDARARPTAVGSLAQVVERLFSIGRHWPALAPLFGTREDDRLGLESTCSTATRAKAALSRGRMYADRGDFDVALGEFERARTLLESADDVSPRLVERMTLEYWTECGGIDARRGEFEDAKGKFENAFRTATELGDRSNRALGHLHLGAVTAKTGDGARATAHFRASRRLYRDVDDEYGAATALHNLGLALGNRGRYDEADRLLERATATFQRLGDRLMASKCRNRLGLVAYARGEYDEAESHWEGCLRENQELGYRVGVAKNSLNLGNVRQKRGEYDGAKRAYERTLRIARAYDDQNDEANCLNNLGLVEFDRGNLAAAIARYERSLEIGRRIGNRRAEARALTNLGEAVRERGEPGRAGEYHRDALELMRDANDALGVAICERRLGHSALAMGDLDRAETHLREAADRFREFDNDRERAATLEHLVRVAEERGDDDLAAELTAERESLIDGGAAES